MAEDEKAPDTGPGREQSWSEGIEARLAALEKASTKKKAEPTKKKAEPTKKEEK